MIITKFQNFKIIWTPGSNLAIPVFLSRNITSDEYQKHQLQHKLIPRKIEFFDESGTPVSYQNQHEDNSSNDTCNDSYRIKYKRNNEKKYYDCKITAKTLPSVEYLMKIQLPQSNRLLTAFEWVGLSTSFDQYKDQKLGPASPPAHLIRTIVQATLLVWPTAMKLAAIATTIHHTTLIQTLKMTISYVTSVYKRTNPDSAQANGKQALELVLGKTDASLVKKFLANSEAPHLDTKALIQKLNEVVRAVDFDVSTILVEQIKDPVFATVRSLIRKNATPLLSHQRFNSPKVFYDIDRISTDFILKNMDSSFATSNRRTN